MLNLFRLTVCVTLITMGSGFIYHSYHWFSFKGITTNAEVDYYRNLSKNAARKRKSFWLLYKPTDKRAVAFVGQTKTGNFILNPEKILDTSLPIEYGDIPSAKKLSKNKLNLLWGEPISGDSNYQTYALSTSPPVWYTFRRSTPAAYFLIDAKFEGDYLKAYRFRKLIWPFLDTQWTDVNSR